MLLTRKVTTAVQLPAFVYDEVGTTGHAVAEKVRDEQIKNDRDFFRKVIAPVGSPEREGLPERCDREWYSKKDCGGEMSAPARCSTRELRRPAQPLKASWAVASLPRPGPIGVAIASIADRGGRR